MSCNGTVARVTSPVLTTVMVNCTFSPTFGYTPTGADSVLANV